MNIIFDEYEFSDDKTLIPIDKVCKLLENSYWTNNVKRETVIKAIDNSICIGIYKENEMIGFARLITDYATIIWIADLAIDENYKGKGLETKTEEVIRDMKNLKDMCGIFYIKDADRNAVVKELEKNEDIDENVYIEELKKEFGWAKEKKKMQKNIKRS